MTAAIPTVLTHDRLAQVARPASGRVPGYSRSLALAGGNWIFTAPRKVADQLTQRTGPTRCSRIVIASYPPCQAEQVLADLPTEGVDPVELAGARLAAAAVAPQPHLWLFIATCRVLWNQPEPLRRLS